MYLFNFNPIKLSSLDYSYILMMFVILCIIISIIINDNLIFMTIVFQLFNVFKIIVNICVLKQI